MREGAPVAAALARDRPALRTRAPLGAHQRADVENDDDAAVAEDGGAGDAADAGDLRADGLHHDLAAADQLIGHESGGVLAGAHQHHRNGDVLLREAREGSSPTKVARCWKRYFCPP